MWWFELTDTGPGLPVELVQALNTLSDGPPPRSGGAQTGLNWLQLRGEGIGLRIVRELARLLDARLEVYSEAGQGTRFLVSFPRQYLPR